MMSFNFAILFDFVFLMQLVLTLIIWVLFGMATAYVAQNKGRDPGVWFAIGMLLGVFGLILVYLLPPVAQESEEEIVLKVEPLPRESHADERMKKPWFYLDASGNQQGPVPLTAILEMQAKGEITADTYLWCEGMPEWQQASELHLDNPSL